MLCCAAPSSPRRPFLPFGVSECQKTVQKTKWADKEMQQPSVCRVVRVRVQPSVNTCEHVCVHVRRQHEPQCVPTMIHMLAPLDCRTQGLTECLGHAGSCWYEGGSSWSQRHTNHLHRSYMISIRFSLMIHYVFPDCCGRSFLVKRGEVIILKFLGAVLGVDRGALGPFWLKSGPPYCAVWVGHF